MIGLQARIDLVKGWVQAIRTANGYATELGANVVTERVGEDGRAPVLVAAVVLSDLSPVKTTRARRDWQLDIAIEARIPVTYTNAEAQALLALEDLVRCVPTVTTNPDDNLQTLELSGAAIDRQPDGTPYIVVSVTLRATCYEFISQPA